LNEWHRGLTLFPMTAIPGFFIHSAMRRSLLGAHAQDPVVPDGQSVPDRPLRIGRFDRLATLVDARPRRRDGTLAESEPAPVHDRADERRAA
jgi:hypothetical protein